VPRLDWLGHGAAEETIHLFAMAMRHRVSAAELAAGDAAYPMFSSDVEAPLIRASGLPRARVFDPAARGNPDYAHDAAG
jgi:hypothetical protein